MSQLDEKTLRRLRAIAQRLVDERYDGKVTKAAEALGISHPMLLEFLAGTRGAGMKLLTGLQNVTGTSLDELVRGSSDAAEINLPPRAGPDTLASHPDYPPLRERLLRHYPEETVRMVDGAVHGMKPTFLDWDLVKRLADAVKEHLIEKEEREHRQTSEGSKSPK